MKRLFTSLLILGLLAGCAENMAAITNDPITMQPISENAVSRIVRYEDQYVRTFVSEDTKVNEVVGARCSASSAELKGAFVTPSIVRMPIFKGKPTSLRVSCTGGKLAGNRTVKPTINGTAVGGASAAGLVAAMVTSAIVVGRDQWGLRLGATEHQLTMSGVELKTQE